MKVYVCEQDKNKLIDELSVDVQNSLRKALYDISESKEAYCDALGKRVFELENLLDIEYMPEKLTFFVFNNLRFQQDGVQSACPRFETLQEAIREYESLPKEYTSALGGYLGPNKCFDFVHRRNGESVLVTDFLRVDEWRENGSVQQAIDQLIGRLSIRYESDIRLFGDQRSGVLVPLRRSNELNSYFADKVLDPTVENRLLSAINEVYVEGKGWTPTLEFLDMLDKIDPYHSSDRLRVGQINIRYVDERGHQGQADLAPSDFALLKDKTEKFLSKRPTIDAQISDAEAQKEPMEKRASKDEPIR